MTEENNKAEETQNAEEAPEVKESPSVEPSPVAEEATEDSTKDEDTQTAKEAPAVEESKIEQVAADSSEPVVSPPKKEATVKKTPKKKTETKAAAKPANDAPDGHWWWGTGRRKAAVARVRIRPGTGEFQVNKRNLTEFFSETRDHQNILAILDKTNTKGSIDVFVNANGGGYTGQAGAIILGLGRALSKYDPSLESTLRDNGYLSRDPRKVERKKPGQPGARKRFQFSKR